jgi:toxin ParE1/3/4
MAHRLAPQAAADLDGIWYYVAKESGSIDIVNHLIDSITDRFSLLSGHPYLGRTRDDDLGIGLRSFPVGEYVIVYCVENDEVLILRVVHGRRDLETLFGNSDF